MLNRIEEPSFGDGFFRLIKWTAIVAAIVAAILAGASIQRARAQNYDYIVTPLLALSNTAQTAKASPGTFIYYSCVNPNATAVFLQVFDSAGVVTVGTTAPKFSFSIPATSSTGSVQPQVTGGYFASAGLQAAVTTTATGAIAPSSTVPCDIAHR